VKQREADRALEVRLAGDLDPRVLPAGTDARAMLVQ